MTTLWMGRGELRGFTLLHIGYDTPTPYDLMTCLLCGVGMIVAGNDPVTLAATHKKRVCTARTVAA